MWAKWYIHHFDHVAVGLHVIGLRSYDQELLADSIVMGQIAFDSNSNVNRFSRLMWRILVSVVVTEISTEVSDLQTRKPCSTTRAYCHILAHVRCVCLHLSYSPCFSFIVSSRTVGMLIFRELKQLLWLCVSRAPKKAADNKVLHNLDAPPSQPETRF